MQIAAHGRKVEPSLLIDWLFSPIDPSRPHEIEGFSSWHARLMVLAWMVLIPLGILGARFFKVLPKQDWPNDLDNPSWWYAHLIFQWSGAALSVVAMGLILWEIKEVQLFASPHHFLGWITVLLLVFQVLGGLFRGSKGGPTYPAKDGSYRGDHFDMSKRRVVFETLHKSLGYIALLCAFLAVFVGLWSSNAMIWIWVVLGLWVVALGLIFRVLQKRHNPISTYQAIWGPDPSLPGNKSR